MKGVLAALKACLALGKGAAPPMWLSDRSPATDWIVFRNGVVNVLTGELRQPSPDLWVQSALGFDWDPNAQCPRWVQGEAHLRRILKSYARYYNETRTHLALDKDVPLSRTVKRAGRILCRPVLGGLHHEYVRI